MYTPWSVLGTRRSADWFTVWEKFGDKVRTVQDGPARSESIAAFEALGQAMWEPFRPPENDRRTIGSHDFDHFLIDDDGKWIYDGPFAAELKALNSALVEGTEQSVASAETLLIGIQSDASMASAPLYSQVEPVLAAILARNLSTSAPFVYDTASEFRLPANPADYPSLAYLAEFMPKAENIKTLEQRTGLHGRAYRALTKSAEPIKRQMMARTRYRFAIADLLVYATFDNPVLSTRFSSDEADWWWSELGKKRLMLGDLLFFLACGLIGSSIALWSGISTLTSVAIAFGITLFLALDMTAHRVILRNWVPTKVDGWIVGLLALVTAAGSITLAVLGPERISLWLCGAISYMLFWVMRFAVGVEPPQLEGNVRDARITLLVFAIIVGLLNDYLTPETAAAIMLLAWPVTEMFITYQTPVTLALRPIGSRIILVFASGILALALYVAFFGWIGTAWLLILIFAAAAMFGPAFVRSSVLPPPAARGLVMGGGVLLLLMMIGSPRHGSEIAARASASELLLRTTDPQVDWRDYAINGSSIMNTMRAENPGFYSEVQRLMEEAGCNLINQCYSQDLEVAILEEVRRLTMLSSNDHLAQINANRRDYYQELLIHDPFKCGNTAIPDVSAASTRLKKDFVRLNLEIVASGARPAEERKDVQIPSEQDIQANYAKWREALVPASGFVGPNAAMKQTCAQWLVDAAARSMLTADQQGTIARAVFRDQMKFARDAGIRLN